MDTGVLRCDGEQRKAAIPVRQPGLEDHLATGLGMCLDPESVRCAAQAERRIAAGVIQIVKDEPPQQPHRQPLTRAAELAGSVEEAEIALDHLGPHQGVGAAPRSAAKRGGNCPLR